MKTNTTKPETLLTSFTRTPILICVAAAVAIHIVVIGATSIPQLFASEEKAMVEEETDPVTEGVPAAVETPRGHGEAEVTETRLQQPEEPMSDVERRVREVADPAEIPRTPDPLDIDLGDTN